MPISSTVYEICVDQSLLETMSASEISKKQTLAGIQLISLKLNYLKVSKDD